MKKAVIIPDSYKGTLSSAQVCEVLAESIAEIFPGCETVTIPVADGGEGSVDCFIAACGGEKVSARVSGPFGEPTDSFYGVTADGTAVVETAACAGLPLVEGRADPGRTTTFGVGELLLAAARRGCKHIIVGLGGSCTNDCGCGAAAAAGVRFFGADGRAFLPVGDTLADVCKIDASGLAPELRGVKITAMCDIDNPLFGPQGAAYVFAPQKGASSEKVLSLDAGLRSLAAVIRRDLGADVSALPCGGAAGGMGAGLSAFFMAPLLSGIEAVLTAVGFEERLTGADWVFTGEGRLDSQSARGKVVSGVARAAARNGVPVIAVVGGDAADTADEYPPGVSAVFSINRLPEDFSVTRLKSRENLRRTADNILRLIKAAER